MTTNEKTPICPELWTLAEAACNGALTAEQYARLNSLLTTDENAARFYSLYLRMHGLLIWESQDVEALSDTSIAEEPVPVPAVTLAKPLRASSVFLDNRDPLNLRLIGYSASLVITGLLVIGAWFLKTSNNVPVGHNNTHVAKMLDGSLSGEKAIDAEPAIPDSAAIARKKSPHMIVGRITSEVDCRWTRDGGRGARGEGTRNRKSQVINQKSPRLPVSSSPRLVCFGDKFSITSGLLEITFNTGAKVTLEGPCEFNADVNGGFLAVGRLNGRMEKSGSGSGSGSAKTQAASPTLTPTPTAFVIITPTALVTDLGTEFGIDVAPDKQTIIHVIRGEVEARRDSRTGGTPLRERLTAGQAIYIASLTDRAIHFDVSGRPQLPVAQNAAMHANAMHIVLPPELRRSLAKVHSARQARRVIDPIGIVASAYHHVWDASGNLWAENDRELAFIVATDSIYGQGENNKPPRSSFDTGISGRKTVGSGQWVVGSERKYGETWAAWRQDWEAFHFADLSIRDGADWPLNVRNMLLGDWKTHGLVGSGQWTVDSEASGERKLPVHEVQTKHQQGADAPRSPLSTAHCPPTTAFVGLYYSQPLRFDRIKVFLARQTAEGGSWSELPRVFILKHPVDTNQTPPESDPANWRELPHKSLYGGFSPNAPAGPGAVLELTLTTAPAKDRTGYGWALGGVPGNGSQKYIAVTELRAYVSQASEERTANQ